MCLLGIYLINIWSSFGHNSFKKAYSTDLFSTKDAYIVILYTQKKSELKYLYFSQKIVENPKKKNSKKLETCLNFKYRTIITCFREEPAGHKHVRRVNERLWSEIKIFVFFLLSLSLFFLLLFSYSHSFLFFNVCLYVGRVREGKGTGIRVFCTSKKRID